MYDELIKRLRASCENCKLCDGHKCCLKGECSAQKSLQAADAIEELEKELRDEKVANVNLTGLLAEEHANKCPHYIRNIQYIGNGSLCDKCECKIASLPKWIPVTERLPEKDQTVLAYCAEDNFCYISRMHQSFEDYNVTHWISLPQMPESEDN